MFFAYGDKTVENFKELKQIGNSKIYDSTIAIFKEFRSDKDDLKHIDRKMLESFREFLIKRGCKINTISVYLRTLRRAIYNRAVKENAVSEELISF